MKNKKRYLLGLFLVFSLVFTACSKNTNENKKNESSKRVIYTSFFPVEELTKRIVKDKFEVKSIIDKSEEPHSFELKTEDIKNIIKSDLVIYNGAGMETFIDDLKASMKDENKFVDLSQGLELLSSAKDGDDIKKAVNPHTWLSIKNAMKEMQTIYEKVSEIDPENKTFTRKTWMRT